MNTPIRLYKNNRKLKATGVQQELEPWQVEELIKCMEDPIYFIRTYVKIVHVDRGIIPFAMWDFQEKIVGKFHDNRHVILKLPRQCGKTQTTASYILHYILFNEQKTVAILANKGATAREILSRVKMSYEELPHWLQVGVVEWNKGSIELGNGSSVIAAATSGSAIRGLSISLLYLDEFAFLHANSAMDFFESVYPTVSSGKETKILITSTPKGLNHFYRMYTEAVEGRSEFTAFEIKWNDIPGRDEEWRRKTISSIGELSFEQEYNCVTGDAKVTVRIDGVVKEISIEELFCIHANSKDF